MMVKTTAMVRMMRRRKRDRKEEGNRAEYEKLGKAHGCSLYHSCRFSKGWTLFKIS